VQRVKETLLGTGLGNKLSILEKNALKASKAV